MNDLVCLDMPNGPRFVDRIKQAWDDGDAVFPLDQRLPPAAKQSLIASVAPTLVSSEQGDTRLAGTPIEHGDAVVVATSGTTGNHKAVVLTMSAVEASARATSQRLGVGSDDCWLACLPPSHVGGLSVITRSIIMGTRVIAVPSFSIEAYDDAAAMGATLVSLVATALQRVDPTKYRTILLGGSTPPSNRPAHCLATYGLTESGSGIVYEGRALEGVDIDIRDSIVYVRAPMLLRAYRDGSSPLDSQGWLRTGDRGSFDNGILSVHGREDDLIISGGENIWPEQVEDALRLHPGVHDVCVAGVPDDKWGQAVHAWVVAHDVRPSLHELRNLVKETLPAHCAPQYVHFVADIPRTTIGKARRSQLVATISG